MREPPESHKQRFYKLPQLSWSWVATLIVYWGDFSSEGYYLHIRNSYTFKSSRWTSAFLLFVVAFFSKLSPEILVYPSQRLAVVRQVCWWCVLSPSVFNLKSLLQIIFHWLKKYTLQFQTEHGLSRSFFVQSEKYFLLRYADAYVDPDVWVSKSSTSMRKFWYMRMLKYVKLRQHNLLKFSYKRG